MKERNSALSGFYRESLARRRAVAGRWGDLDEADLQALRDGGLSEAQAGLMIENVIGRYSLPFALATNFRVNQRDYLIPMVLEEPSVVAACSYAAKLFRVAGGFQASSDEPVMIGQLQLLDLPDLQASTQAIKARKAEILAEVNAAAVNLAARGGGARELELRQFPSSPLGDMLVLHLHFDTRDAMGANAINSALESIAPTVERISGGRVNLRILSNLSDQRKASAQAVVGADQLATERASGAAVIDAIIEAATLGGDRTPTARRRITKGIMNGIDALLLATGNDWRAVEAGAHCLCRARRAIPQSDDMAEKMQPATCMGASKCRWLLASSAGQRACMAARRQH